MTFPEQQGDKSLISSCLETHQGFSPDPQLCMSSLVSAMTLFKSRLLIPPEASESPFFPSRTHLLLGEIQVSFLDALSSLLISHATMLTLPFIMEITHMMSPGCQVVFLVNRPYWSFMATQDSGMLKEYYLSFTDAKINSATPRDMKVPPLVSDRL